MSSYLRYAVGRCAGSPAGLVRVLVVLLCGGYPAGLAWAQSATSQEVDRSFQFIDRLSQATDLYNAGKAEEALGIFQELLRTDPAQDEDGSAAMGVADCLMMLERQAEARSTYAAVLTSHPELASSVGDRLAELDVAEASDEALARLRAASASGKSTDQWRLGRALQKRAQVMLAEAVKAFRATAESESADFVPASSSLAAHAAAIEELNHDLSGLIEQTETFWGALRGLPRCMAEAKAANRGEGLSTERGKAEYLLRTRDGQRVEIQLRGESGYDSVQVTVDGKAVELAEADRRLIQRHQDRINAILMEAAGRGKK